MKKKYYGATIRCLTCNTVMQSKHCHDFNVCKCWDLGTGIAIDGGGEYLRMAVHPDAKYEVIDHGKYFIDEKNTAEKKDSAEASVEETSQAEQGVHPTAKKVHGRKAKVRGMQRRGNGHTPQKRKNRSSS